MISFLRKQGRGWLRRMWMPCQGEAWFVSHSYKDELLVKQLQAVLPSRIKPVLFPPIEVPVTEFVSDRLLDTIEDCSALIYLDTKASRESFWVSLEVEQAKRLKKRVYRFDHNAGLLVEDTATPLDLPIYISFSAVDEDRVRQIALWAKHKRGFDLWYQEQTGLLNKIFEKTEQELRSTMQAGGHLIAFVSEFSATRGNLKNEILKALQLRPSNVLLAWLDDPRSNRIADVNIPPERQIYLRPNSKQVRAPARGRAGYWPDIKTIVSGKNLPVLARDVDDLIVRVYWMRKSSIPTEH